MNTITRTATLTGSERRSLIRLQDACRIHDRAELSYPLDESDATHFLNHLSDGTIICALAIIPCGDSLAECIAFTLPEYAEMDSFQTCSAEPQKNLRNGISCFRFPALQPVLTRWRSSMHSEQSLCRGNFRWNGRREYPLLPPSREKALPLFPPRPPVSSSAAATRSAAAPKSRSSRVTAPASIMSGSSISCADRVLERSLSACSLIHWQKAVSAVSSCTSPATITPPWHYTKRQDFPSQKPCHTTSTEKTLPENISLPVNPG